VNAEANERKSQLDVEKYGPLAKAQAASQQVWTMPFRRISQTSNGGDLQSFNQAAEAAVETARINLNSRGWLTAQWHRRRGHSTGGDLVSATSGSLTTVSTLDQSETTSRSASRNTGMRNQFSSSAKRALAAAAHSR